MTLHEQVLDSTTPFQFLHITEKGWTMPSFHSHDSYELNLSVSGGHRFFVNGFVHHANKGDLFYFTDKDIHKNIVPESLEYDRYLILFHFDAIRAFIDNNLYAKDSDLLYLFHSEHNNKLTLSDNEFSVICSLLNECIIMSYEVYDYSPLYYQTKLIELLMYLTKLCKSRENLAPTGTPVKHQIHQIMKYIDHHIASKLSTASLAQHFFIDRTYMCELFKKETGFTINHYITAKRLVLSKQLLIKGTSVIDVTDLVGFKNDAYFIRWFREKTGITPKQYALREKQKFTF